jgi:hypothetical protein
VGLRIDDMSRFQTLLSHQGPLTHVNHAHRCEVPTGRITYNELTGEWTDLGLEVIYEPPEPLLTSEQIAVNKQVSEAKIQVLTTLLVRIANMQPHTVFLENQLTWVQEEIERAQRQMNGQWS